MELEETVAKDCWVTITCMTEPTSRSLTDGFQGTEAVNQGADPFGDVSTAVVVALAEAKGLDPLELDEPLHDWLDPDALDAVIESIENGHIAFDAGSHRVRVESDGTITVDSAE